MSFYLQKILSIILLPAMLIVAEERFTLPQEKMTLNATSQLPLSVFSIKEDAKNNSLESISSPSTPNTMREHTSLAYFSLGSLAVGGIFYAIQQSSKNPHVQTNSRSTRDMNMALGFAGLSALVSGGAFFYFSFHTL